MQILRGIDARPPSLRQTVATTGKFIVVHRGHRALLDRLHAEAEAAGAAPAVVTFDRHPLETIAPDKAPACVLATVDQRLEQLEEVGVEVVLLLEFTAQVASLSPEEYVERALVHTLRVRKVIEGEDHRFGHRHAGDMTLLAELGRRHGFEVETMPLVKADGAEVSSTEIRRRVAAGDVTAAAAMMGRPYRVAGLVVEGARRGRTIGFPTINVDTGPRACMPAFGVYAGWWRWKGRRVAGVANFGMRPTFNDVLAPTMEMHLLDFDEDLYGEHGELELEQRLRDEMRFSSVEELKAQIAMDVKVARSILSHPEGGRYFTG